MNNCNNFNKYNLFVVPPHLTFHDIDEEYLTGMFEAMPSHYSDEVNITIDKKFNYPKQMKYGAEHSVLSDKCKQLKLKNTTELQVIERHLNRLKRSPVDTKADKNSAIRAVLHQLHVPRKLTSEIVRHQIASYMVEQVNFFHPIMQDYLNDIKMSFKTYIRQLYRGNIWGDQYMLGALGKMCNIKISVISPYYTDIWNVFHDSAIPDIVLIANGGDFFKENGVTHFTTTRGDATNWNCVGHDLNPGEVNSYKGRTAGEMSTMAIYETHEKRDIQKKTEKIAKDINMLCGDVKNLCLRRDKIYEELNALKIPIDEFKRFDRYHITKKPLPQTGKKSNKKDKHHKRKVTEEPLPPVPQKVADKLLAEVVDEMDLDWDIPGSETADMLHDLFHPPKRQCRTKNVSSGSKLPSITQSPKVRSTTTVPKASACDVDLPFLQDVEDVIAADTSQKESVQVTVHKQRKHLESSEVIKPFDFAKSTKEVQKLNPAETGSVIVNQPKASNTEVFRSETPESLPLFQDIPKDAHPTTMVTYSGVPMQKQIAEFCDQNKKKAKDIPKVHKPTKSQKDDSETLVTVEVDQNIEILNPVQQISTDVQEEKKTKEQETVSSKKDSSKKEEDNPNKGKQDIQVISSDDNTTEDTTKHQQKRNKTKQQKTVSSKEHLTKKQEDNSNAEEEDSEVASSEENTEDVKLAEVIKCAKNDPNKLIVLVTRAVDTSKLPPPIPEGEQDPNYIYCTRCDKKFKDRKYFRKHNKTLCEYLTEVEMIQCKLCGNFYRQDKTYRDHLTKHTKEKRFQVPPLS